MPLQVDLLVVGVRWPPETFIQRRLVALAQYGVRVAVAASATRRQAQRFSLPGVTLVRLPTHNESILFRVFRLASLLLRLTFSLRARKSFKFLRSDIAGYPARAKLNRALNSAALLHVEPKVVHFEWNTAAIDYGKLTANWECPQVVSCRGGQVNIRPHVPGNEGLVQGLHQSFQNASAVHCVSLAIQREAGQYGLDPAKSWVIRPAVDPEFFCPSEKRSDSDSMLVVITTGSLIWRKAYEYALLAIRKLVDMGIAVRFDIIGDGPERQRILYTMDDLGLKEHIRLLGQLTPADVRDHLQQADIFLLSSLSEGISNAVLEAMACGLPVVTTDCGGMREAVTDGVEGFVVPVRSPEAIAEALGTLVRNPTLREKLGKAGREKVLKEFTLEQQTEQFLALYRSLMVQKTA